MIVEHRYIYQKHSSPDYESKGWKCKYRTGSRGLAGREIGHHILEGLIPLPMVLAPVRYMEVVLV